MKAHKETKIKNKLQGIFKIFWQKIALFLVLFFVLDLVISGFLFWRYFIAEQAVENIEAPPMVVNEGIFNQFISDWEKREEAFNEASNKSYPDPFSGVFVNENLEYFPEATSSDIIG